MASSWIERRRTPGGKRRFIVRYRLGGRESKKRPGGSFARRDLALKRKGLIDGMLAAGRVPDLRSLFGVGDVPSFGEAARDFLSSLIHLADETLTGYRTALNLALSYLEDDEVDQISWRKIADMIKDLAERGYARSYIRLIRHVVRLTFDYAEVDPNPARHRFVKLPPDTSDDLDPPTAPELEAVFYKLPKKFRLGFLTLECCGGRIGAVIDKSKRKSFDASSGLLLSRKLEMKKRRAHFNNLHPAIAGALLVDIASRPADCERLFPDIDSRSLREAIRAACKEAGVRHITPHHLRHRRISLLAKQRMPWPEIGEFVGQDDFSTTERTYTHVMLDPTELDYDRLVRDC